MDLPSSIATSRLVAQQRAIDVIAANIANANTPGFKTGRVLFNDWLARQQGVAVPPGAPRGERSIAFTQDRATWREQQPGTVTRTGNSFDLALTGDGWFTVNTPAGPRLTRDGRFGLMPDGTLADGAGNPVLDANGQPIQFAPAETRITIAGDGTVSSENGQLARVGVVQVSDPMRMSAEGNTLFRADAPTIQATTPAIVQGAIEDSNVQPVQEVTRMIDGLRQFQFASQLIQAESDRAQAAIEKILPQSG
jgi:flagellar basal-body rod protein FlgF